MLLRMLSGRPRHLQILLLSLAVLVAGIAAGFGRASPAVELRLETAAAVVAGSDAVR